jgi:hypothetical protein
MDVAIRAANWIYALNMFMESDLITQSFLQKLLISLYEHGWYIIRNLERNHKGNANHFDADISGLLIIALIFKDIDDKAKKWYFSSKYLIIDEMRQQVLPSGVILEKTLSYIRLVTEFFLYSYLILKNNNEKIPLDIEYRIESALNFVINYLDNNGNSPVIGDQDNGRFLPFSIHGINDHRYLLTFGAVLFKNPSFKKYSEKFYHDVFFFLGDDSKTKFNQIVTNNELRKSIAYKDAGYFIMRSDDIFVFINNSGQSKYFDNPFIGGSHTHADLLSFVLHIGEQEFLVDTGSYLYTSSSTDRNLFRSTKMHNTVEIDNSNQYITSDVNLFRFESVAYPKINEWISNDNFDLFDGEHDGYQRLSNPVKHRRIIYFNKIEKYFEITDELIGVGNHLICLYYHFHNDIKILLQENVLVTKQSDRRNIQMFFENKPGIDISLQNSWISKSYGKRLPSLSLKIAFQTNCPTIYKTRIKII